MQHFYTEPAISFAFCNKKIYVFFFQIINKKIIVNVISLENLNIKQMLSVKM